MLESDVSIPKGEPADLFPEGGEESQRTRERLLAAAGEIFAAKGFKDATVREICARAGANVAAVNYYFGDKQRMYARVLQYADELSMRRHPEFPAGTEDLDAERRLEMFIGQFVARIFDEHRPAWHDVLIEREMIEPTGALAELAQKNIRPRAVMLQSIVRNLMTKAAQESGLDRGSGASTIPEVDVQLASASVVGQIMLYHRCRSMIEHLMPAIQMEEPGAVKRLAEHITKFSLAAIRGMAARGSGHVAGELDQ